METIIQKIEDTTPENEKAKIINKAGEILKNGGLVAFPTETVYGLGANALDEMASSKIYDAKGRPSDNPLIVHIAKIQDLEVVASYIPDIAFKLADKFWPGPLTMILNKTPLVPLTTTGGLDTVAVRMPKNELALELIEAGGGFIAAPSANSSGKPSPTTASHVINDLMGNIDMIVDGGSCNIGLESTIIDLTTTPAAILRPGFITASQIEEIIGRIISEHVLNQTEADMTPKAPGMKYKHYAPKADLSLFAGRAENVSNKINALSSECIARGKSVGIICSSETKELYNQGIVEVIGSLKNSDDIASHLYDVLRGFDAKAVDYIFSETFFLGEKGDAIMNRLNKAAGGKMFICTGSIDYSMIKSIIFVDDYDVLLAPLATSILRNIIKKKNIKISSRGLNVSFAEPINPKVKSVLYNHNMTDDNHKAKKLMEDDFTVDNTIVAINPKIKNSILSEFKNTENLYTISELIDDMVNLKDPFGLNIDEYENCYNVLFATLVRLNDLLGE